MDNLQSLTDIGYWLLDLFLWYGLPALGIGLVGYIFYIYMTTGEPFESFIAMYFGRRGQGKTVAMVMDLLSWLGHGHVVYTNIKNIKPSPKHFPYAVKNLKNLHEVDFQSKEEFIAFMDNARDCIIVLDEAIIFFDSKNKKNAGQDELVRHAIFTSRHRGVSIAYGVQRPMTALKDLRDVTDIFYQCTKTWVRHFKYFFTRTAFDLNTKGDDINQEEVIDIQKYRGSKVFGAFEQYGARNLKVLSETVKKDLSSIKLELTKKRTFAKKVK